MSHGFESLSAQSAKPPEDERQELAPQVRTETQTVPESRAKQQSAERVRNLVQHGEVVSAEQAVEHVDDPNEKVRLLVEIAAARPNFSPTEYLERGREVLNEIKDSAERSAALANYAQYEIAHGFRYDVVNTIEQIENPRERFDALRALHAEFTRLESRVWDPEGILEQAERAAQEMGDAGQSPEVLAGLAFIAGSYRHEMATAYANKIKEPELRAQVFQKLAVNHRQAGEPDFDYQAEANKARARAATHKNQGGVLE